MTFNLNFCERLYSADCLFEINCLVQNMHTVQLGSMCALKEKSVGADGQILVIEHTINKPTDTKSNVHIIRLLRHLALSSVVTCLSLLRSDV